ncbi:MAG: hypothetical protein KDC87_16005 [Planctomycetes bacterium]|nr:hypothetical protein [Planctomycetota bacterium]MCB9871447.1 hypothetical protein [Planctomycetota bacterium]
MSVKQLLFGPSTVTALGVLLLVGLALHLLGRVCDAPLWSTIGLWLAVPFLTLLAVLLLVVAPWTWITSRRR